MCWEIYLSIIPKVFPWISENIMVILTFLAIVVALFKKDIYEYFKHAKLDILIEQSEPHFTFTKIYHEEIETLIDCYYFRIWVFNKGNTTANNVQLTLETLKKFNKERNEYETVSDHSPMRFKWAHTALPYEAKIFQNMGRHCDIINVIDDDFNQTIYRDLRIPEKSFFSLNLEKLPNNLSFQRPPGKYKAILILVADNFKPIRRQIRIEYKGWTNSSETMFKENMKIEIID